MIIAIIIIEEIQLSIDSGFGSAIVGLALCGVGAVVVTLVAKWWDER